MIRSLSLIAVSWVLAGMPARADPVEDETRRLFREGREHFERKDFGGAYEAFKQAFRLSHSPALLFNLASALRGLERPHDAAEELRAYLRLAPGDPEKPEIEERILALEEEQRLLDRERAAKGPNRAVPLVPRPSEPPPPSPSGSRRLAIGLAVAGAAVALIAGGVAIGFAANGGAEAHTPSTLGPIAATR